MENSTKKELLKNLFEDIPKSRKNSTYLHRFFKKVLQSSSLNSLIQAVYHSQGNEKEPHYTMMEDGSPSYGLLRKGYLKPIFCTRNVLARRTLNNDMVLISKDVKEKDTSTVKEEQLFHQNVLNFCEDLQVVFDLFHERTLTGEAIPTLKFKHIDLAKNHVTETESLHQNNCIWTLFGRDDRKYHQFIEAARKEPSIALRLILRGMKGNDDQIHNMCFESQMQAMKNIWAKEYSEHYQKAYPPPPDMTDQQSGKKKEQSGNNDEQSGKKDEQPGKKDEQSGKKDEQSGKKNEQSGKKDVEQSGKKDQQSGKKDEQSSTAINFDARFWNAEVENYQNVLKSLYSGKCIITDEQYEELVSLWISEVISKIEY